MTGGGLTNPAVVSPAPRPSEGQGVPIFGRGHIGRPLFVGFCRHFLLPVGPGTHGRAASRAFLSGMGAFLVPPRRPFSHAPFVLPRPRFFFFFLAWPSGPRWVA